MEQSLKNIFEDASSIEGDSRKKEKSRTWVMLEKWSLLVMKKVVVD